MNNTCTKCKVPKPISKFHKNTGKKSGLQSWCILCRRQDNQRYYKENKQKVREKKLKFLYNGFTLKDYDKLLRSQRGKCAICGAKYAVNGRAKKGPLYVDHNHQTGRIRGLLCARCNFAVGFVEVNSKLICNINEYLEKRSHL